MFHNWANQYLTMHVTVLEGIKDDRYVNWVPSLKSRSLLPYLPTHFLYLLLSVKLAGNVHNMKPGFNNVYRQSGVKAS